MRWSTVLSRGAEHAKSGTSYEPLDLYTLNKSRACCSSFSCTIAL